GSSQSSREVEDGGAGKAPPPCTSILSPSENTFCQNLAFWCQCTINHSAVSCYLVRSEFELDRICGYGTARCRKKCQNQEYKIGRCPNTYVCCLKKWDESLLNFTKH
ncbi:uncharacterized protein LOC116545956, partial [Sapajus apella]|uniref:Beta-defensin n=1 Tax=Sapajus apella TaxID=9515 RepID=A0A6J3HDH2_SAPAP